MKSYYCYNCKDVFDADDDTCPKCGKQNCLGYVDDTKFEPEFKESPIEKQDIRNLVFKTIEEFSKCLEITAEPYSPGGEARGTSSCTPDYEEGFYDALQMVIKDLCKNNGGMIDCVSDIVVEYCYDENLIWDVQPPEEIDE